MDETLPWTLRRRPVTLAITSLVLGASLVGLVAPTVLAQDGDPPTAEQTWARASVPDAPAGVEFWDVTAGGPGFIAVGGGFTEGSEEASAAIWVSDDGRAWQSVPLFGDAARGIPRSITTSRDGYVAVGSGCCPDVAAVWLSPDGLSWERLAAQPGFADTAMLAGASTPEGLVAAGCSAVLECISGLAWTSPDGRSWSGPVSLDMLPLGLANTSEGTLALGASEPYEGLASLALSEDGSTWSAAESLDISGATHAAIDVPDGILAVGGAIDLDTGDSAGLLATSADGLTWEALQPRRLRGLWLEDVADLDSGFLLAGWRSRRDGQVPVTLWTTDLRTFDAGAFPRDVKQAGVIHALAVSEDAATAVAVGATFLHRGTVPTIWVDSE